MALSKMMQHYVELKEKNKDSIVFYRLGDFYEMFFEDAQLVSKLLGITLTGKDCGLEKRAPMCGVPYHSADTYIARLLDLGYKVAICEQLSEPKAGQIVERDIVRVITPGTVMEENILEAENNFIASVCFENENKIGLSWLDISTGEFFMCQFSGTNALNNLNDQLVTIKPSEIISDSKAYEASYNLMCVKTEIVPKFYKFLDFAYDFSNASKKLLEQLRIGSLAVLNCADKTQGVCAAGALLEYIAQTQKRSLSHINKINIQNNGDFLYLDANAKLNLELTETIFERKRKGSLIWVLDKTQTTMGKRTLVSWLDTPLRDEVKINDRLDAVEELMKNNIARDDLKEIFSSFSDIERICGRVSYGSVGPRGCVEIQKSLKKLPVIKRILQQFSSTLLKECYQNIADFSSLQHLLENAFRDEVPVSAKDGNFIRPGFNAQLDEQVDAMQNGRKWIVELENKEKEKTDIKNLRIKYNNIIGYFFDVPMSQKDKVPFYFTRKQTLANSERYSTDDLNKLAEIVIGAEDNVFNLEQKIFGEIKGEIQKYIEKIQIAAKQVAVVDVLISFATVSLENRYIRPVINKSIDHIKIIAGRHPVVEKLNKEQRFVPNDTNLSDESRTLIITGPNMAGKSTYMRQVALITLMAHLGCFVPASEAEISICDRIFTRIGASDNLGMGQSTFMVEMIEVASVLENATNKSLLILDEIGRGTSTYDGLSIAWAVVEYITEKIKAFTLFATHYHEITELEGKLSAVKNFQVAVKEFDNTIIFLHNIIPGSANKSFGIEVANLAGIKKDVVERAKQVLHFHKELNLNNSVDGEVLSINQNNNQTNMNEEVINALKNIEPNLLTPLEAIAKLAELKEKLKE